MVKPLQKSGGFRGQVTGSRQQGGNSESPSQEQLGGDEEDQNPAFPPQQPEEGFQSDPNYIPRHSDGTIKKRQEFTREDWQKRDGIDGRMDSGDVRQSSSAPPAGQDRQMGGDSPEPRQVEQGDSVRGHTPRSGGTKGHAR